MERLRAEVTFAFEAESLESAGARLKELADAAADAGFDLLNGRVSGHEDGSAGGESTPSAAGDWKPYGPPVE